MQSSPTCDQAEEDLIPAISIHQQLDAKYEKVDVKDVAQKQTHLIQKAKCGINLATISTLIKCLSSGDIRGTKMIVCWSKIQI